MASLDWSQCPAVESIPGKRSGAWVFRDTRTPVSVVFENLEAGATIGEVMDWFHVTREQVAAVLEFAARRAIRLCSRHYGRGVGLVQQPALPDQGQGSPIGPRQRAGQVMR